MYSTPPVMTLGEDDPLLVSFPVIEHIHPLIPRASLFRSWDFHVQARLFMLPQSVAHTRYTNSQLEYVYGLPEKVRERPRKRLNEHTRLKKQGLPWCNRIVDYANDWESEPLIDLLTVGMLRMEPKQWLSADGCLEKGHHLGLFDGHTFDSGSVTPTQQTALRGEISDDDGSTTIILGALWGTSEISNYEDNGRTACYGPEHTSGFLNTQVPSAPSYELGGSGTAFQQWDGNIQPPAVLRSGPLEAQSSYPMSYKRQRSRAGDSAKQHSGEGRIKCRQRDRRCNGRSISRTYSLLEHRSGQFRSMYEAVLALLADLRLEDSANHVIDDHASALVRNICEYFARLYITKMVFTQNNHSSNVTITAISKSREFVLASLTSSEQMSSTAELAAHLLRMLQFQTPQLRSTPMALVDDTSHRQIS